MDANYGGPVWHASVAGPGLGRAELRRVALRQLDGVGAPLLGQWNEMTGKAFHVRRRVRPEEEAIVGPMLDIRGTSAVTERLAPVRPWLPPGWTE